MNQTPHYWNGCFAIAVMLLLASAAGAQQDKAAIDKLYNAAKKEGRVVIWGPTDGIVYEKMQELLDKQYPGIKIESFESIPEPLVHASSPKTRRASRRLSILSKASKD